MFSLSVLSSQGCEWCPFVFRFVKPFVFSSDVQTKKGKHKAQAQDHQREEAKIKQLVKKYEDETEVEATTERRACECGTTHLWENV